MEITITKKYRPRGIGNNTYNYKTITAAGTAYKPVPPMEISFVETQYPSVLDYQAKYAALYGPHPRPVLVTYDETETKRQYRMEGFSANEDDDGNIDSINWELAVPATGFIILYPTV